MTQEASIDRDMAARGDKEEQGLLVDEVFRWKGFGNGLGSWESKCRVRIHHNAMTKIFVVVVTELPENPGTSVTNAAEHLIAHVLKAYNLPVKRTLWIEHYPGVDKKAFLGVAMRTKELDALPRESFDIVSFAVQTFPSKLDPRSVEVKFSDPKWKRLRKEHVEDLCGAKVE